MSAPSVTVLEAAWASPCACDVTGTGIGGASTAVLEVPHTNEGAVVLLLELHSAQNGRHQPDNTSAEAVKPFGAWDALRGVGYPCLLIVPAVPQKEAPSSTMTKFSSQDTIEASTDARTERLSISPESTINAEAAVTASQRASGSASATATYVCVTNPAGGAGEDTEAGGEAAWYCVFLPEPSLAAHLDYLFNSVNGARQVESGTGCGVVGKPVRVVETSRATLCRDVWSLPTVSSCAATPSTSVGLEDSSGSHTPLQMRSRESAEVSTASLPRVSSRSEATPPAIASVWDGQEGIAQWVRLDAHLRHLGHWNSAILAYLLSNAAEVQEGRSSTPSVTAPVSRGKPHTELEKRPMVSLGVPDLLRLLFRHWHRLLRTSALKETDAAVMLGAPSRALPPSLSVPTAVAEERTRTSSATSPLLNTPTYISREYFRTASQHHSKSKQLPPGNTSSTSIEGGWKDFSCNATEQLHPSLGAASPHIEERGDVNTSESPPSPSQNTTTSNGHINGRCACVLPRSHHTSVALVEQLLLSVDFTLLYSYSQAPADAALLSWMWPSLASPLPPSSLFLMENRPEDWGRTRLPPLSETTSLEDIWGRYLVHRMRCEANNSVTTCEGPSSSITVGALRVWELWRQSEAADAEMVDAKRIEISSTVVLRPTITRGAQAPPPPTTSASREGRGANFSPQEKSDTRCGQPTLAVLRRSRTPQRTASHVTFSVSDTKQMTAPWSAPDITAVLGRVSSTRQGNSPHAGSAARKHGSASGWTTRRENVPPPANASGIYGVVPKHAVRARASLMDGLLQLVPPRRMPVMSESCGEKKGEDESHVRENLYSIQSNAPQSGAGAAPYWQTPLPGAVEMVNSPAHPFTPCGSTTTLTEDNATPQSQRQQQIGERSRIESWESDSSSARRLTGPTAASFAAGEMPQPETSTPPYSTTTGAHTHGLFSSVSTVESEHRLYPLVGDSAEEGEGLSARQAASPLSSRSCDRCTATLQVLRPPPEEEEQRPSPCHSEEQCSAAYFTHRLRTMLRHVLTPSFSPKEDDEVLRGVQSQLADIRRGRLFPSLETLDTLNLLPYYVHVWCYTYDPILAKNRLRMSVIREGGRYAQSYLERYTGGHGNRGGENGNGAGGLSGAVGGVSSSPQVLRGLMMDGARSLWRGVKSTAYEAIGKAAGGDSTTATGGGVDACVASSGPHHGASIYAGAVAGGSGGRDPAKEPSLYYAVCGLYVTEQDVLIRAMPTAAVRERRRVDATLRQQQRRPCDRHCQGCRDGPSVNHVRRSSQCGSTDRLSRRAAGADSKDMEKRRGESMSDVDRLLDEEEEAEYAEEEEVELIVLPRVGLLSVKACTVDRTVGGVFSDTYAHKLFLDQEEQVVALRSQRQQQQQQRQRPPAMSGEPITKPVRTYTTLVPYIETAIDQQRQQQPSMLRHAASSVGLLGPAARVYASPKRLHCDRATATTPSTAATAAAAAALMSSAGTSEVKPVTGIGVNTSTATVVLKLESKSMPTVWLEFADATTLTYVYHLLETPLRSSAMQSENTLVPTADPPELDAPFSSPLPQQYPGVASSAPEAPQPPLRACRGPPLLCCYGNRFLSSARRPWSIVPIVLLSANVLPPGLARTPFMTAFLKNITVASLLLRTEAAAAEEGLCASWVVVSSSVSASADEAESQGMPVTHTASQRNVLPPRMTSTGTTRLTDTWWLYDPAREFARLALNPERWTLTSVNSNFDFCRTYPARFVVPSAVAARMESGEITGHHRHGHRVEAVVFVYAPTGGVLVRSAQPALARLFVGATGMRSSARSSPAPDITTSNSRVPPLPCTQLPPPQQSRLPVRATPAMPPMEAAFFTLDALAAAANVDVRQLTVVDLRTATAAYANIVRGGGTMELLPYTLGAIEYANLPNIHCVRRAWRQMKAGLQDGPYVLNSEGAARRELQYVLHGAEPPYAAVVAAAECSVVPTTRMRTRAPPPPQPPCVPQWESSMHKGTSNNVSLSSPFRPAQDGTQLAAEGIGQARGDVEGNYAVSPQLLEEEKVVCLSVVQQAATASRSGGSPPAAAAASRRTTRTLSAPRGAKDGIETNGSSTDNGEARRTETKEEEEVREEDEDSRHTKDGGDRGANTTAAFLSATTTGDASAEWLGYLGALLNTAVVAARRVCGLPIDPLYVPAMEHNGTTANCYSYIVGHAFTRFWLPSSAHSSAVREGGVGNGSEGASSSSPRAWTRGGYGHISLRSSSGVPRFTAPLASFEAVTHASLAQVVLLNCSDGWDRTAQVSVLTQMLLDPYYRTVEGLCILLERELVSFGHPTQRRSAAVQGNLNGGWEGDADGLVGTDPDAAIPSSATGGAAACGPDTVKGKKSERSDEREVCTVHSSFNASPSLATPAAVALEELSGEESEEWILEDGPSSLPQSHETGTTGTSLSPAHDASPPATTSQQVWDAIRQRATATVKSVRNTAAAAAAAASRADGHASKSSSATRPSTSTTAWPAYAGAGEQQLHDASPIVAQLLDAIFQLVRLYPACFEFTEQFVLLLLDLLHCGLVSTFAVNGERQVMEEMVAQGTLSLSQWCAVLLSTTTSTASLSTAETSSENSTPPFDGPWNKTSTSPPPNVHRKAQSVAAFSPVSTNTTGASSATTSFQRMDSHFLLNGEEETEEGEDGEEGDPQQMGESVNGLVSMQDDTVVRSRNLLLSDTREQTRSTVQESGRSRGGTKDGSHCALPAPSSSGKARRDRRLSDPVSNSNHSGSPPHQWRAEEAAASYSFDCTTRWTAARSEPNKGSSYCGVEARTSSNEEDVFQHRLLPVSHDALHHSGYLNPHFSLRYSRVCAGPLVDFILPSQLTLWRSAYARHSFWETRSFQLQHGSGAAAGFSGGTMKSGAQTERKAATALNGFRGRNARPVPANISRNSNGGGTMDAGLRPSLSHCSFMASTPASSVAAADAAGGGGLWWGEEAVTGSRRATTPSYVSSPGRINFHIGSDSDDDGGL